MTRPCLVAYRALGLGDLLTGVPALRALRDAFPDHRFLLAAPAALEPIVALTAAVDELLDTRPIEVPACAGADVAVNLHGRGPASHRAVLATRPRRMIAFAAPDVPWDGPHWREREHEVARWCRLLHESGIPADPSRLDLAAPPATVEHGATVIHPGAASAARRWPAGRWAAVAAAERRAGRRVLVTGSAAERPLAAAVARGGGLSDDSVLAGRTDLAELAAVVAGAGRVLCGDTGVAHLATALGVPSIVLFGPTPPAEWGPPPERAQHVALHRDGRGDPHGAAPDPRLLAITVDDVLAVTSGRSAAHRPGTPGAMETFDQADSGYPEEGPPEATPDDASEGGESAVRERSRPDADDAPDHEDHRATGNP